MAPDLLAAVVAALAVSLTATALAGIVAILAVLRARGEVGRWTVGGTFWSLAAGAAVIAARRAPPPSGLADEETLVS